LLPACLAFAGPARAEVASEFWPEVGVFVQLNDRSRACFDAAHARGKESDVQSLDVAACLDISLKPIARPELLSKDWQRSKWIYDTRYDDWARTLWTLGAEVTQNDHFRYDLYFARQVDRVPEDKNLNAIGVAFKWYY
jgi:hypothetical protein